MKSAQGDDRASGEAAADQARAIRARVLALRDAALVLERTGEDEIALVHPDRRLAARNLVDYLALRQHDLRDLQRALYDQGLTTLGVVHRHVMGSMDAVLEVLDRLCGENGGPGRSDRHPPLSSQGEPLEAFADDALGPPSQPGLIRVMVTMPSEAADDPALITSLLSQGMTIMHTFSSRRSTLETASRGISAVVRAPQRVSKPQPQPDQHHDRRQDTQRDL